MIRLGREQQGRLANAVRHAYPREACGLLFGAAGPVTELMLAPTTPSWNSPSTFRIKAADIARLSDEHRDRGEALIGCFHSHLASGARPSRRDRRGARQLGGLWLIYSIPGRRLALFRWNGEDFEPQPIQLL